MNIRPLGDDAMDRPKMLGAPSGLAIVIGAPQLGRPSASQPAKGYEKTIPAHPPCFDAATIRSGPIGPARKEALAPNKAPSSAAGGAWTVKRYSRDPTVLLGSVA